MQVPVSTHQGPSAGLWDSLCAALSSLTLCPWTWAASVSLHSSLHLLSSGSPLGSTLVLSLPCILETLSRQKDGAVTGLIRFPFFRPQCPSLPDIPCLESHSLIGGCFRQEGNSGPSSFILSTSKSQNSCFKCVPVSSAACRKVRNIFEKFVAILIDILGPWSRVVGLQAVTEGVFVKTSVKHREQKQGIFRIRWRNKTHRREAAFSFRHGT